MTRLATRLENARQMLPSGYALMIVEGHRPFPLQEHYFAKYLAAPLTCGAMSGGATKRDAS